MAISPSIGWSKDLVVGRAGDSPGKHVPQLPWNPGMSHMIIDMLVLV